MNPLLEKGSVPKLGQESAIKTFLHQPIGRRVRRAGHAYKWPPSIVLTFHWPTSHGVPHRCIGTWERQPRGQVSGREGKLRCQWAMSRLCRKAVN